MRDDLDLRLIHRRHEPDPRFVAALGDRVEAIVAASPAASSDEATVVELEPADSQRAPSGHRRWWISGAGIALAAASVAAFAVLVSRDQVSQDEVTAFPGAPQPSGWVAFDTDGDIYVVRPGEDARRLDVPGSDAGDESCPTWSPDGTRLAFGRLNGSSDIAGYAELVIVPVGRGAVAGAPTVIVLDGFQALPGFDPHPCVTWAPDGRWVAFVGNGEVWVVDTLTGGIRHLPDLRPTDLEWRPGTDELAIAGDIGPDRSAETSSTPVTTYSLSTGELRPLGSIEAASLTWSPDGSTLAYQGGENDTDELRLVDADGANDRLLTHVGSANHGVGPVWSPTGERIAYQRLLGGGERHEVVLVNVADGDETVIAPPQRDGPNGPESWYPYSVTWSPDGTTLLYSAWRIGPEGQPSGASSAVGVLAVDADQPTDVTLLTDRSSLTGFVYDHAWGPVQMWGRQPVSQPATEPSTGSQPPTTLGFADLEDGRQFRVANVIVTIQCTAIKSTPESDQRDLVLGGVVTDNPDAVATLDDVSVAVGDLLALIIRDTPEIGRRVTLYDNEQWYGGAAISSCDELVESVPTWVDGGFFYGIPGGYEILPGG